MDDLDRYHPSDHGATPAQVLAAWAVPAAMAAAVLLLAGCAPGSPGLRNPGAPAHNPGLSTGEGSL